MDKKDEEFLKKLLSTFRIEAKEHIDAITSGLIELEKAAPVKQTSIIETIFREAHSLKGAARSVNLKEIESLCQSMENVFAALKRSDIAISPQLFDTLHPAVDYAGRIISGENVLTASDRAQINEHIQRLESALNGIGPAPKPQVTVEKDIPCSSQIETVRISTAKLDTLLLQAEQLLSVKLASEQRVVDLQEINATFAVWKKEWAKSQGRQNVFLGWNNIYIKSLNSKLTALARSAQNDNRQFGGMVDELLYNMKKALMLPFSSLLVIFPKLIRDLSHDQGKETDLIIEGEDIEIDRRILEEMKDPLIHLMRNCIDHGIEKPDERKIKKKPSRGTIKIILSAREGNRLEIQVSDDGAGIDVPGVLSASVKRGIISKEEAGKLSEHKALSLIFRSGVSTSPIITHVSGRGLGLAIVHEKVEKLNGTISIETKKDAGATFRIVIPLTLTTFRGILVRVGKQQYILPGVSVEKVVRIKKEEIKTAENREMIVLDKSVISVSRLGDILELPKKAKKITAGENIQVVVLSGMRMAIMVDEVLDEQEVVVKSLGKQLIRVRNVAGATILGSGKVVPILNIHDLMKSALKITGSYEPEEDTITPRKSVLVVEDSITARALLKNILETAGYDVITAVDGVNALAELKKRDFDLVVSDVDMPRLNGFGLTEHIRSDKRISELPVVLVTALDSREDKERGIDVGANAYIVKGSFDQNNLLEVIQKLI